MCQKAQCSCNKKSEFQSQVNQLQLDVSRVNNFLSSLRDSLSTAHEGTINTRCLELLKQARESLRDTKLEEGMASVQKLLANHARGKIDQLETLSSPVDK